MNKLITATAFALFATAAAADDVYHGLAEGNTDLFAEHTQIEQYAGVQPGVGDSFDRYQSFGDGNTDLFKSTDVPNAAGGDRPDVYDALRANPDITW